MSQPGDPTSKRNNGMKAIKAVIFDFNGTLVSDTHLHNLAWYGFFRRHNLPQPDEREMFHLHGKTNSDILSIIFGRRMSLPEVKQLGNEKEEIYRQLFKEKQIQLLPGAIDLFRWLNINNIPFTIATASDKDNVDFYFEHLQLGDFFDRPMVVFNDGNMPGKPDPELFNKAIQILGFSAAETLIFEDSFNGIKAAENAAAGSIVIVDTHGEDYSAWSYPKIKSFLNFDFSLFG